MYQLDMALPYSGLRIQASDDAITHIDFIHADAVQKKSSPTALLKECCHQLRAYVKQANFKFDLPLAMQGTDFQQAVWRQLQAIPWGETLTYGDVAEQLNSSPRAVGNACRRTPVPLIVPCHRVVAKTGIGGFAGDTEGGFLPIKVQLLRHEGLEF